MTDAAATGSAVSGGPITGSPPTSAPAPSAPSGADAGSGGDDQLIDAAEYGIGRRESAVDDYGRPVEDQAGTADDAAAEQVDWRARAQEYEQRFKGLQGTHQQTVEQMRRHLAQQQQRAGQQQQQLPQPTHEDLEVTRVFAEHEADARNLWRQGQAVLAQEKWDRIEAAKQLWVREKQVQLREQQAQQAIYQERQRAQQMQAHFAPVARKAVIEATAKHYGLTPKELETYVEMGATPDHLPIIGYVTKLERDRNADKQRAADLREAAQERRAPPARASRGVNQEAELRKKEAAGLNTPDQVAQALRNRRAAGLW